MPDDTNSPAVDLSLATREELIAELIKRSTAIAIAINPSVSPNGHRHPHSASAFVGGAAATVRDLIDLIESNYQESIK